MGSTCPIAALWERPDNKDHPSPDCFGGLSLSVAALATLGSWESCRNIPVEVGHSDEHWQENPTIVTFDWLVKTKENWKNMLSPATTRTIVQYIAGEHHPPNNKNQVFDHCQKKLSVQLEFSCHIYIYWNTERIHNLAKHPWQEEDQEKSNQLIISKYSPGYLHLNIYSYPQYFPSFLVMFINSGTTGVTHDSKSARNLKRKDSNKLLSNSSSPREQSRSCFRTKIKKHNAWSIPQMSVLSLGR